MEALAGVCGRGLYVYSVGGHGTEEDPMDPGF